MDTRERQDKRNKTPLIARPQSREQAVLDRHWAGRPMGRCFPFPTGEIPSCYDGACGTQETSGLLPE